MKKLINILLKETQNLQVQYIELTKKWARNDFVRAEEMNSWNDEDWCEYLGLIPILRTSRFRDDYMTFPKNFYNTKYAKTYSLKQDAVKRIVQMGFHKYVLKNIEQAEKHYTQSIEKLAFRINKKGLNIDNLKTKTGHVGVNIETTLTDGEKTVRAWTIIASGIVQRPHYRYLIK